GPQGATGPTGADGSPGPRARPVLRVRWVGQGPPAPRERRGLPDLPAPLGQLGLLDPEEPPAPWVLRESLDRKDRKAPQGQKRRWVPSGRQARPALAVASARHGRSSRHKTSAATCRPPRTPRRSGSAVPPRRSPT